jgi:hypothetical protein
MKVHFAGICMFDTRAIPFVAYLPNVSNGLPQHQTARPHDAFIAVPPDSADFSGWGSPLIKIVPALGNKTYWIFPLDGVDITFNPPPSGPIQPSDISLLPKILDLTGGPCPTKTRLRSDLATPDASFLSALVMIPGGPLQAKQDPTPAPPPDNLISYTVLTLSDSVTITATDYSGPRTRTLTGFTPGVEIGIVNVDQTAVSANDLADRALNCALLEEDLQFSLSAQSIRHRSFPITLGPGCSNSQFP